MSGMKRAYGYLFNRNLEIEKLKEKEKAELRTETSTEAIYNGISEFGLLASSLGKNFLEFNIIGQKKAVSCQWKVMSDLELNLAFKAIEELSTGDNIRYWTRGINNDPREWFFKIERI